MSESILLTRLFVGGIPVEVYSHSAAANSSLPVNALFLLHGRQESTERVAPIAKSILDANYSPAGAQKKRDLIDHRNHGTRLVDALRNDGWNRDPSKNNAQHAVDMYTIQTGTVQDVTFLIDHIPSYLYPLGEREVVEWGIAGISLGGHSTWIALTREPRIRLAIPIIGCPDYTKLMSQRAERTGVPFTPPYYPPQLKVYVDAHDPANFPFRANDATNPFLGKRILVLSGAKDKLVPWTASTEFVEGLEVGDGVKKVVLEENAGHECTPLMVQEAALFVSDWLANSDWMQHNNKVCKI
ncbi:alpha/beta-hydrolase [Paxillus ammoniavirescens]|nr:alpha/beta-hydrolase [Paxillus ammoniavirescens]